MPTVPPCRSNITTPQPAVCWLALFRLSMLQQAAGTGRVGVTVPQPAMTVRAVGVCQQQKEQAKD